jgi:cell division protein FtsB
MSIQSTRNRILFAIVLFALVLAIGISIISTSHAAAAEMPDDSRLAQMEQMIAQLRQENAALIITNSQLSQQVAQLQSELNTEYILVLRHEDLVLSGLFGDSIVVNSRVQQISVSKAMFDSCEVGDDITNTALHRLLAPGNLSQTRVIVENKISAA